MTRSVDELLHHMPVFARKATNDWSRGFARSILKQSKQPGWTPSARQTAVMTRMVDELFIAGEGDIDVIEAGDKP